MNHKRIEKVIEHGINIRLLKMLLNEKIINQATYNKVVIQHKRKEAA